MEKGLLSLEVGGPVALEQRQLTACFQGMPHAQKLKWSQQPDRGKALAVADKS